MIHRTLERRLSHAAALWRLQSAIRSMATLLACVTLAILAIGFSAWMGWIASPTLVYLTIGLTLAVGAIGALVAVIRTFDRRLDRQWLAAAVERDQEPLLDRLNAVLELERQPDGLPAAMYGRAIETQATQVLKKAPDRSPFSWQPVVVRVAVAILAFLTTIWFYVNARPLQTLAGNATAMSNGAENDNRPLMIPDVTETSLEAPSAIDPDNRESWVEVRISEPGRDLRITRFEEVRLLIEAASDRPLTNVAWSTTVNLEQETEHPLPELEDPRYAVFQPVLRPDELGLREWDLVFYRAKAVAEDNSEHRSATYFVEVIPSRDALEQIPDDGYERLEAITELIEQQQEVIRQTDRLAGAEAFDQAKRMEALAEQENRIAKSTEIQQVELEDLLRSSETKRLRGALEAARESLRSAQTALQDQNADAASAPEQKALLELADARRQLADLIAQHPEAFQPSTLAAAQQARDQGITPADPEFAELLKKIDREAREIADVSRQLEELTAQQQALLEALQRRGLPSQDRPQAARQERGIQLRLEALKRMHPEPFRDLTSAVDRTTDALDRATKQLAQEPLPQARAATEEAGQALQQLSDEVRRRELSYQVAQQETLQDRLEANRKAYQQIHAQPEKVAEQQLTQTTAQTEQLVSELQQLASQGASNPPTAPKAPATGRDRTEPVDRGEQASNANSAPAQSELAKQLTSEKSKEILGQCRSLRESGSSAARSGLAGQLDQSLEQLAKALKQDLQQQGSTLEQQQLAAELEQMQQRDEAIQNAREFVQQTLNRQRMIQRDAFLDQRQKQRYPSLAENQANLEQSLANQRERNPDAFDQVASQCQAAQMGMQQAAQSLRSRAGDAPQAADDAAQQLQKLDDALAQQQDHQRIRDEQLVQDQLRQMSERLESFANQPDAVSPEQKRQTAGQCKSLGSKACELASQSSGGSSASSGGSSGSSGGSQSGNPSAPNSPSNSQASNSQTSSKPSPGSSPTGTQPPGGSPSPGAQQSQSPSPTADQAGGQTGGQRAGSRDPRAQQIEAASDRLAASPGGQQTAAAARELQRQLQQLAEDLEAAQPNTGQQTSGPDPSAAPPGGPPGANLAGGTAGQPGSRNRQNRNGQDPNGQSPNGQSPSRQAGSRQEAGRQPERDMLRPGGIEAIERGLAQLQSAARRRQQGNLAPQAEQSLRRGGLADITIGIRSHYGYNENSRAVIGRLTEEIADSSSPVDMKTLQQLREQIQSLQQDVVSHSEENEKPVATLFADPSEFPADYRNAIQKYYQNLSEER